MKYLFKDLYERACYSDDEQVTYEWNQQYKAYMNEYDKIKKKLPKDFINQFDRYHFHDNIIKNLSINIREMKKSIAHDLSLELIDYHDKSITHILLFKDIINFKSDLSFGDFAGSCDWLHCEILKSANKKLSIEIALFTDSTLYFEFSELLYNRL